MGSRKVRKTGSPEDGGVGYRRDLLKDHKQDACGSGKPVIILSLPKNGAVGILFTCTRGDK